MATRDREQVLERLHEAGDGELVFGSDDEKVMCS